MRSDVDSIYAKFLTVYEPLPVPTGTLFFQQDQYFLNIFQQMFLDWLLSLFIWICFKLLCLQLSIAYFDILLGCHHFSSSNIKDSRFFWVVVTFMLLPAQAFGLPLVLLSKSCCDAFSRAISLWSTILKLQA